MVNPLSESSVVFSINGSTDFDRFAVLHGFVCCERPHLVAGRHVGSGAHWLDPALTGF